jgi:hypothetical protein
MIQTLLNCPSFTADYPEKRPEYLEDYIPKTQDEEWFAKFKAGIIITQKPH